MPDLPNPSRDSSNNDDPARSADERAIAEARGYVEELRQKMERLSEDFAQGRVNTTQFQELYAHYQQERQAIEETLQETPGAASWRATVSAAEGESTIIRRRHAARILGYAIYLNDGDAPLRAIGKYDMDDPLISSMMESLPASGEEEPDKLRGVELEDGRWVGFVPGQYTTLVVLFSVEPARTQLGLLRDLQSHFERANQERLARGVHDPSKLVFPHAAAFE